jgi:antitoxin (DNA-binding transcriptional repressor) of toxin-antitoxin stability system/superfamily II DNA/RNA helicase
MVIALAIRSVQSGSMASHRYSLADARASFATLLARAALGGERFRFARRGIDVAALLGPRDLAALEALDDQDGVAASWDSGRPRSPRMAREQLADKLANVEAGERVAIEKRGRVYAALVPMEDLDRLEERPAAAVGPTTLHADSRDRAVDESVATHSTTVSTILIPSDASAGAVIAELRVWADRTPAAPQTLPGVRCASTPRPKNHDDIAEALQAAAMQHQEFGSIPAGFTYDVVFDRSRDGEGRSLADLAADISGASIQAPAFLAASFAMLSPQANADILATGALNGAPLGSIIRKIDKALNARVRTLVVPYADAEAAKVALIELGLVWNPEDERAEGLGQSVGLRSFQSERELYDVARRLCGEAVAAAAPAQAQALAPAPAPAPAQQGQTLPATVETLWQTALSPEDAIPGVLEQELLRHLGKANPTATHSGPPLSKRLTLLQQEFLAQCRSTAAGMNPFLSDRHLLISGGTSSGKTTLMEILSVATVVRAVRRNRVLYVAPTRALAQLRYRELEKRYGTFRPLSSSGRYPIVLATGEDSNEDWRFRSGDFSIAIVVYEKANVLAQIQRSLLDKVGLIVVDEAHMLSDSDRGPMLEMFLLKAINRRVEQEQSTEDRGNEKLRIAVISTEVIRSESLNPHPLVELLTETKVLTGEKLRPIVVAQPYRPGKVSHFLVVPNAEDPGHFRVRIAEYVDAASRTLSRDQLIEVERRLNNAEERHFKSLGELGRSNIRLHNIEPKDRLYSLLKWLSEKYSEKPRRVLVFMPSVREIISMAGRLKNSLGTLRNSTVDEDLQSELESLDDASDKKNFLEMASVGVFIHHAGVDRQLRDRIAELWSQRRTSGNIEFLFATETLAFGVNLSVDDVIMYGTRIFSAPRNRNKEGVLSPYTPCEFHNMIGRAGRLGLVNDEDPSNVYILPTGDDQAREILRRYYLNPNELLSKLFVEDDVVLERSVDLERRLDNVSHAFVHAMLDLLRFLAPLDGAAATVDEMMGALQEASLYCREIDDSDTADETRRRLRQSIETVLEGCAAGPEAIRLVTRVASSKPAKFRITQKGKDVLDTGTEIQTLVPLTKLTVEIERGAWIAEVGAEEPMPAELALLAVAAQRECFRSVQKNVPEARLEGQPDSALAEANAVGVFESFSSTLNAQVPRSTPGMAVRISEIILDFCRDQAIARPELRRDAILRIFTMMLLWIDGRRFSEARRPVELLYPRADQRPFSVNINSFSERLSWKLELLARLLAPKHEPYLADMVARVRLGCPNRAIALLEAFPRLKRTKATAMVAAGCSPDDLLRLPDLDISAHLPRALDRGVLSTRLRKDASRRFNELIAEMCGRPGGKISSHVNAVEAFGRENFYLSEINAFFGDGSFLLPAHLAREVETPPEPDTWSQDGDVGSFEEVANTQLWSGGKNARRLEMIPVETSGGYLLRDHEEEQDEVRLTRLLVLGVRSDWSALHSGQTVPVPFARILEAEASHDNLLVAASPWLPHPSQWSDDVMDALDMRKARGQATAFLTAPALCALLVLLGREFESPDALLYSYLIGGQLSTITVRDLRENVVDVPDFPGAIRRAMAKFNEFGFSIPRTRRGRCDLPPS